MTEFTSILELADQCVKCGLCSPQCPTYTLNLNENESPRGRISLIQGIANLQLVSNEKLLTHLDHCLQCRRCERVCPSQVKYGEIISGASKRIPALKKQDSLPAKLGLFFLQTPRRLRLLRKLLRFYQLSGLQFVARTSGILSLFKLKTAEQLLPGINKATTLPKQKEFPCKVALFTGCSQTLFDSEVIAATVKLLNALEIEVIIPEQQTCCGALHNLQGEYQQVSSLINNNENVFAQQGIDTVLYLSTGCGVFIKENYTSSIVFQEITEYLANRVLSNLTFGSLDKTVAVHVPCTQKNVLHQADTATPLIKNIPKINLVSMEQQGCCGAGGTTMLKYPALASEIRQPILDKVMQDHCNLLVTTNPGCQLHLQNGLKNEKPAIKVMHPVTLLAQQLEAL